MHKICRSLQCENECDKLLFFNNKSTKLFDIHKKYFMFDFYDMTLKKTNFKNKIKYFCIIEYAYT